MDDKSHINAENVLLENETAYALDWQADSFNALQSGFYAKVSNSIEPKPGEIIVDIGAGLGNQLIDLMVREPKALTIGTERTRENVRMIVEHFRNIGLESACAAVISSSLEQTIDGKVFWQRICRDREEFRKKCRPLLETKILFLDDDIRYPVLLPTVLGDEKIDTGVLSLPGGSSNRAIEWPFDPTNYTQANNNQRIIEAANATRFAFYHYMAEHVRPGGRIIVAERIVAGKQEKPGDAFFSLIGRHMKDLRKYWNPHRSTAAAMYPQNAAVELRASDKGMQEYSHEDLRKLKREFSVVIGTLERNTTQFSENPLPRPA